MCPVHHAVWAGAVRCGAAWPGGVWHALGVGLSTSSQVCPLLQLRGGGLERGAGRGRLSATIGGSPPVRVLQWVSAAVDSILAI